MSTGSDYIEAKIKSALPFAFLIISHLLIMSEDHSRMFWPYMIASYAIAFIAYYVRRPLKYQGSATHYMFTKEVWLHRSSVNDYTLFIFNYIIYFHMIALYIMHYPYFVEDGVTDLFQLLGLEHTGKQAGWGVIILFTLSTLMLAELAYYLLHRAYHEIPFLWELHKVHHSAEVMTPLTYIRSHPIDLFLQQFLRFSSIAFCNGVFLYFYPSIESVYTIAGIDAGLFIYYIMGANLHHSHIWIRFPAWMERILISPAQHQIHHSTNPKHFDLNYGSMIALYDWMFKSLYIPTKEDEDISFGLTPKEQLKYNSLSQLLIEPIRGMYKIAAKNIKTKMQPPRPSK